MTPLLVRLVVKLPGHHNWLRGTISLFSRMIDLSKSSDAELRNTIARLRKGGRCGLNPVPQPFGTVVPHPRDGG